MSKVKIQTAAVKGLQDFNVSTTHPTTLDVGVTRPVNILPAFEGDKFDVRMREQSFLSPLAVRTFGTFELKTHAFFVPLRVIWPQYMDYISRSTDASVTGGTPRLSLMSIFDLLLEGASSATFANWETFYTAHPSSVDNPGVYLFGTSDNKCDISVSDGTNTLYFNFTAKGRWLYNTLISLGYEIPLKLNSTSWFGNNSWLNMFYSALPLIAYGRCLYDFIYPSRYVQQQGLGYLFEGLYDYENSSLWLPDFMKLLFCSYNQDFFNSLWAQPNSPAVGQNQTISSTQLPVSSESYNQVGLGSSDGTRLVKGSYDVSLTANSFNWLTRVADYLTRSNLAGTRFFEWMKAHTNHVSKEELSYLSKHITTSHDVIEIGSVIANAETDGARLGDRAGIGSGNAGMQFSYTASERGFLIWITQVVPVTQMYQGLKPWCHDITSPFDFYTPDFDGLGMEGVPLMDVVSGVNSDDSLPANFNSPLAVFGYSPRYTNKYKRQNHFLSGDFRLGSRNIGLDSYHTMRNVLYGVESTDNLVLNQNFLSVDNQYNRIFQQDPQDSERKSLYDKIFTIFRFDVTKWSHMKSVSDSIPMFHHDGEKTEMAYLGTQL